MMKVWHTVKDGQIIEGLADTQNKAYHSQLRRPVANLYSMTHVQRSEPFVDNTIKHFLKRLHVEFIQKNRDCDIDKWLLYCECAPTIPEVSRCSSHNQERDDSEAGTSLRLT